MPSVNTWRLFVSPSNCIRFSVKRHKGDFQYSCSLQSDAHRVLRQRPDSGRFCALLLHICLVFDSLEQVSVIEMDATAACNIIVKIVLRYVSVKVDFGLSVLCTSSASCEGC